MASKIMNKVMNFMGFNDDVENNEEFEDIQAREREEAQIQQPQQSKRKGQVVSLHANNLQRQIRVVVIDPLEFDEVVGIADHLKARRPVVINLEITEPDIAEKVIDFVSGCSYALDGTLQKIGNGMFISIPSDMEITSELKEQIQNQKSGNNSSFLGYVNFKRER